ncbi:hypothetical protein CP8484711_2001A, partial [Chlamydia psittaci 84-8471/1]
MGPISPKSIAIRAGA